MKTQKDQLFVLNEEIDLEVCGEGVERKILSYTDNLMCVENHFVKGAKGAMHKHPHTQIVYVVSGEFTFTIGEETKVVKAGDSMTVASDVMHGCACQKDGILLDIFTPMRQDFV